MNPADQLADIWFNHPVLVKEPGGYGSRGPIPGSEHTVSASVNASAQVVTTSSGNEVTAAATLRWGVNGVLPKPGWTVTLDDSFGLKPDREVITARRVDSGTGLTPDYVEVTIK